MRNIILALIAVISCTQVFASSPLSAPQADILIKSLKEKNSKCSARLDVPGAQENCDETDQIASTLFLGGWCFDLPEKSWSKCSDVKLVSISENLRDNKKLSQERIFGYVNGVAYPSQISQIRIFRETYYPDRPCDISFADSKYYKKYEMRLPNETYKGCYAETLGGGYRSFYLVNGQPIKGIEIPQNLMYTAALFQNGTIVITGKVMSLEEYKRRIGIYP